MGLTNSCYWGALSQWRPFCWPQHYFEAVASNSRTRVHLNASSKRMPAVAEAKTEVSVSWEEHQSLERRNDIRRCCSH
jgi:hypothetical protein